MKTLKKTVLLSLLLSMTTLAAPLAGELWLHVHVDERDDGEDVRVNVPLSTIESLLPLLEEAGVVGPSTGSKARDVLMTPEELAARRGG